MKFDMGRAWNDAITLIRGNREVLAIVAGVFFLLPGLAIAVLFADQQAQAMAMMQAAILGGTPAAPSAVPPALPTGFALIVFVAFLVQLVGYLTLLAIMDDRRRPTVGEAIATAGKCLLPLLGAAILFGVGYVAIALLLSLVLGLVVGLLSAVLGTGVAAGLTFIGIAALMVAILYIIARLSMTMPEIVLGRTLNPVRALMNSWRLTRGNALRLFLFYLLLMIVYLVISMLVMGVVLGLVSAFASSSAAGLINGIVSGLIGLAVGVVVTAIMAAVYRQLAGESPERLSETFG